MVLTPDPILIQVAKPVTKFDKKLQEYLKDMRHLLVTAKDPIGVGIAAPQAGIPYRIFLARPSEDDEVETFINPEITAIKDGKSKKRKKKILEGCLSIPNIWGNVARKGEVTLAYQDENGKKHTQTFKGFMAVIIQHEMDHLNGILFTRRVIEQNEVLYRSYKNEHGEEEFEEMKI